MSNAERKLSLVENEPVNEHEELYEALRSNGMDQKEAGRIANSQPTTLRMADVQSEHYEAWGYEELLEKAQQLGIGDRSHMSKQELIKWIEGHDNSKNNH